MASYRIMFVLTPPFDPTTGGVQMTTYKLSKWLASAGHDVGVFSFTAEGHVDVDFVQIFTPINDYGPSDEVNLDALNSALHQFQPSVVINQMPYEQSIGKALRKFDPPLLLGCLRNTLFSVKNNVDGFGLQVLPKGIARLFRNRLGRAVLLTYHRRRHKRDLEIILNTYDYFVMFAPQNLEELSFFVPDYDRSRIKLIPNSIPFVLDRVPQKDRRVLWLGRVSVHQKRADLILPLWERVQALLPDWQLDVVGDGPGLDVLKRSICRSSIKGVTLHGRQEPDKFFYRSAIYVMTSAFEGFPNTLVEAQSFGAIPVLFNTFPVARFIVTDRVDGYFVEPFELDTMANRIAEIAQSKDISDIGNRALESARRFEIDTVGKLWLQLFDDRLRRDTEANAPIDT